MPRIHERLFRIRYYECDAYGHLNNTNYLRYMQETAFDASAAAGFDMQRYDEIGRLWLVRETEIEYLQPLRYGDSVRVRTWVADFRRSSSRRRYELYNEETGQLAARAFTDWVLVDTATRRPVMVPDEMKAGFFPEGAPEHFPPRERYPTPPPPPPGAFSTRRRVAWQDIDTAQHVNNAVYLTYVEDCGIQVIAAHNWPWTRMAEKGFAIILRRHKIQYLQPALFEDELEVCTWAYDVRRSTATRHYTIRRAADDTLLVQVNTLGVWVALDTGRPIRIPPALLADFAPNIVQENGSG